MPRVDSWGILALGEVFRSESWLILVLATVCWLMLMLSQKTTSLMVAKAGAFPKFWYVPCLLEVGPTVRRADLSKRDGAYFLPFHNVPVSQKMCTVYYSYFLH